MKIAYFDCFAGAGGDMILGALLDAGLSLETLKKELGRINLGHYEIYKKDVIKQGIGGTQAVINIDQQHHKHHHRRLSHIKEIIENSGLKEDVRQKGIKIFTRLAEAEARVHRTGIEDVHFHEVGAVDAVIDVMGAVIGLDELEIDKVVCSPIHAGCGTIECAHGILPVPAPATAELIKNIPVYSTGVKGELLTPTGAAILTTLASWFGSLPGMTIESIGYGAGTSERNIPNLLRLMIGNSDYDAGEYDQVAVLETNIDDMNPQIYDYLIQKILDMGANDVFLTPVHMKKNRPGILLTLVCPVKDKKIFSDFILRETTAIGIRHRFESRIKALRKIEKIETKFGQIRVKIAEKSGEIINITPEYDDCRQAALENNIPLKHVMEHVKTEALRINKQYE